MNCHDVRRQFFSDVRFQQGSFFPRSRLLKIFGEISQGQFIREAARSGLCAVVFSLFAGARARATREVFLELHHNSHRRPGGGAHKSAGSSRDRKYYRSGKGAPANPRNVCFHIRREGFKILLMVKWILDSQKSGSK